MGFTDVLKKAYPFLTIAAQAVPGGNVVTSVLGQILKLKSGDTLNTAGMALLSAPPEIRAQLQAEEDRHVEAMRQMGINSAEEFEQITASDRADARNREVKTGDSWTPRILTACVMGLAVYVVVAIMRGHADVLKDPVTSLTVGTVIGAIFGDVKQIIAYYFGSSAGSDRKTELLAEAEPIQK